MLFFLERDRDLPSPGWCSSSEKKSSSFLWGACLYFRNGRVPKPGNERSVIKRKCRRIKRVFLTIFTDERFQEFSSLQAK